MIESGAAWKTRVSVDEKERRVLFSSGGEDEAAHDANWSTFSFTPVAAFHFARALDMLSEVAEREGTSGMLMLVDGNIAVVKAKSAKKIAQMLREAAMIALPDSASVAS